MKGKFLSYWLPVAAWCFIIFYLSGVPHLKTELGAMDMVLRKLAHLTEYAVLFLLSRRAMAGTYPQAQPQPVFSAAIIFSIFYAATDEFHQSFVPGRGPSVIDVGIDTAGVFAGFFIYRFLQLRKQNYESLA
ncbi:MAG: hypothetical protein A2219_08140 [Elusimicrobia bacterium RIFOXYA2_FULL_50_26]|nr:MAG: hypothetical protein A2219_08140 [Elusimicrobia bacterium RIFOXYA2_FULL_50_26]OGS25126.1 MAG: hypothetical protein A2314_05920 [Elusimicrobia bacterium RIFOXYB2_FULL_50_12]